MNGPDADWNDLRAEWVRTADGASAVASAQRQFRAARRGALLGQALEAVIAVSGIALVAVALLHAANALHAALGLAVGGAIAAVWLWRRRLARDEQQSLEAAAADHHRIMRSVQLRRSRAAVFVWSVLALDLIFLIPWWINGSRVHSRRLTDPGAIETIWIPVCCMLLLAAWAWRVRARALRYLKAAATTQLPPSAL